MFTSTLIDIKVFTAAKKIFDDLTLEAELVYLRNEVKLEKLLSELIREYGKFSSNPAHNELIKNFDLFDPCIRMLDAWYRGEYGRIPVASLAILVASFVYFITTFDAIPDFIPVLGYNDDAAIFGYALSKIRSDLDEFQDWEQENTPRLEE